MSIFSKVNLKRPKSSTFNLTHDKKFSMNMGELVPNLLQEVVPGDKFHINTSQMVRMMPMLSPVMHEINVVQHYFFVPTRLLWNNWEQFITGGESGLDISLPPTLDIKNCGVADDDPNKLDTRLADYLGLPVNPITDVNTYPSQQVSLLPFLAYNLVWYEYYRDQNLQKDLNIPKTIKEKLFDGPNDMNIDIAQTDIFKVKRRSWQHDYFTSALPFAQKGEPVRIPLGDSAPINWSVQYEGQNPVTDKLRFPDGSQAADGTLSNVNGDLIADGDQNVWLDNSASLEADLSEATSTTINELRRLVKLQEWLEKNARAGSRYVESILAHFGVYAKDQRLQRPEYLGGGMSPVMISEVLQTSETGLTPLADMAGHGLNLGRNGGVHKYAEEHGYIIGICSIMPRSNYFQGVNRLWTRNDKFDYFWPEFQHIGEQEILNRELFLSNDEERNKETFGYIPRYAEYKYNNSSVSGYFKTSLDYWHLARKFSSTSPPELNSEFIECNPSRRIFAVEDELEDTFLVHMLHSIKARRPMSYFGDPSFR